MTYTLRLVQVPHDYPHIARLLNTILQEPVTAEQLQAEDARIPAQNRLSRDEDGLLGGFGRERVVAVSEQGEIIGYAATWRAPWAAPGVLASTLVVDPAHRNLGVGTALLQHLEAWGRAQGASCLLSEVPDHLPASRLFLEKNGYAVERHMFQSVLELANFDFSPYQGTVERVEQSGIRFVNGQQPDAALHEFFLRTYRDNPAADELPPLGEVEQHFQKADPALIWLALDGDTLVGMTELIEMEQSGGLYNEYTGVDPSYRGRGIALALKLISIRQGLERKAPYMRTDNDSENAPMLAVNRKLGYVPAPGHLKVRKEFV
ncbi:GNAT family N-acetyltransferase [Tumebacillus flagellatus]|uniref:N-acetyltransferase domain-containing protein n=1 Tax=Tumebacillus flagellatus TaxID=1157490 RepID=A0A074LP00_9BACL|nr:GNAT family N-acetyltransferase [Tumebacillus flagellatus]KEO83896.1 hypothetical protein EL26_06830 [Tumebacillus flagellatus]